MWRLKCYQIYRKKKKLNRKEAPGKSLYTLIYAGQIEKKEKALGKRYTNNVKYI